MASYTAEQAREWRAAHPGASAEVSRNYRKRNPGTSTERSRQKTREAHAKLGGVCVRCGFTDRRALQIDHINGGGKHELKRIGHHGIVRRVIAGEPGYQLLCANCNWIKRHENGEGMAVTPTPEDEQAAELELRELEALAQEREADGSIPMYVTTHFELAVDTVGGYEVVILVLHAESGTEGGQVAFALPSEDAIQLARALIGTATTVRPISTQEVIKGLDARIGENV